MFQDEAGYGRINKPKYCWCFKGLRPTVPCHHICDGAAWHKAKMLQIPENIRLFFLPPATPEMNPIEQIWKEIRKRGFRNGIFKTLDHVITRLCDTISSLSHQSITGRDWIKSIFLISD